MITEGAAAPAFQLKTLNGGQESLESITARGPALLVFFKITCPTCQMTFPYLERLSRNSKLQVFGISQDDEEGTKEFNTAFGVTFPTLLDNRDNGYAASNGFAISYVPSLFVVEADGIVSAADEGFTKPLLEELGVRAGVAVFQPTDKVPLFKPG